MKKILLVFIISTFFVLPAKAQENTPKADTMFKAQVLEVLKEETKKIDGRDITQQNLRLKGLEGEFRGEEVVFNGIGDLEVAKNDIYKEGDKVLVAAVYDHEGNVSFYVTDHVRTNALWWLVGLFVVGLLVIGRFKGLKALISLVITFAIIIKYIIPGILSGSNPLLTTIIGSALILLAVIYITEGFRERSHVAVGSIFLSLTLVFIISYIFVRLASLSGLSGESILPLISLGGQVVNFQGLLLAGILIGSLGVLDDVVVSQIATVEEIVKTDPYQHKGEIFSKAYRVGVSHISSMVNTLFLAYAGVSLPLLILFVSGGSAFESWWHIVNNEAVATEIVRTLAGSIGIILSVPLATALAVWWYKK